MPTGIYKIINSKTGRFYIGSAVDIASRLSRHRKDLRDATHHNQRLQNAWDKYGASAFVFETLVICSKANLIMYEQLCIDGLDAVKTGYNISPTAGSCIGVKHTPEARARMSAGLKGIKHTKEHRSRIAAALKGRKMSPEHLEKLRLCQQQRRESTALRKETQKMVEKAARSDRRVAREKQREDARKAKIEAKTQRVQERMHMKKEKEWRILQGENALKTIQNRLLQECTASARA